MKPTLTYILYLRFPLRAVLPALALLLFVHTVSAEELPVSKPTVTDPALQAAPYSALSTSISSTQEPPISSTTISAPTTTSSPISEATVTTQPDPLPILKITGILYEKGTRKTLPRVNIYCFPQSSPDRPIKTTTDNSGAFSIEVPEGGLKWVLSVSGYRRLEIKDKTTSAQDNKPRTFFLEKTSYLTYETTVYGQTEKRDDKTKSLTQEQFATVPGANGDPVKAVQNLPGVNRGSAFSSQVIIEGSSPYDTRYNLDNQDIPIIFHFGGLSSVVMPEAVDHVDYLSAGFGPEFGQTTAGLVNLTVKDPQSDRRQGFIYFDTMNAGGMAEGPVNDHSSYLFGIRQSYIGYIMKAFLGEDDKDLNFTTVPEFRDLVLVYRNQVTPEDTFKIVTIASQDTFAFLLKHPVDEDPAIRGNFKLDTKFFRIIPEWTHRFSSTAIGRFGLGMGKDWELIDLGDYYVRYDQTALTGRAELESEFSNTWKSFVGLDFQYYQTTVKYQLPDYSCQGGICFPTGELNTVSNNYDPDYAGLYWRNVFHVPDSRWSFLPGVRISYFNLTKEFLPEPRLGVRYALDHGLTLRAASGLYNQAPPVQTLDKAYGNPDLTSQRAVHYTVGFEKDFRDGSATGWSLSNDFFYKHLYHRVAQSTAMINPSRPQYYDNSGYGHIYGLELMGKYKTLNWQGWIAYTLSRSLRGDSRKPETISQYDQTHLLTVVAERELGRNWKVSTRVRYTTGTPYTPIVDATYDANNDVYLPVRGDIYSQRMGAFFQADLRFDKKFVYDKRIVTLYLDIQNITNRKNLVEIHYSYNYQQSVYDSQLPIFPTLGLKMEF